MKSLVLFVRADPPTLRFSLEQNSGWLRSPFGVHRSRGRCPIVRHSFVQASWIIVLGEDGELQLKGSE